MPFRHLLALLFATSFTASAQMSGRSITAPTNLEFISEALAKGKGAVPNLDVQGTPFVTPAWTLGRVLTVNGPVDKVWLKYDLANDQLLWRRPAGDSLELNTAQIREFAVGDSSKGTRVIMRRYLNARIESPALRTTFFEVRYDAGHSALLSQRTKRIVRSAGGP